jgi:hypothetical protein
MQATHVDPNALGDIDRWNDNYKPSFGFPAGMEVLPDGMYDFEIKTAAIERTNDGEAVMRIGLQVSNPGPQQNVTCSNTYWFKTQDNVDILGGDLCTLGFDADKWTAANGRQFSKELASALPRMVGLRIRGQKLTRPNKNNPASPYHNLRINARLAAGQPSAPAAYAPPAVHNPPTATAPQQEEEIPF